MPKIVVWEDSFKAASDLSAKQFCPVELTAENTIDACNAAADVCIGILQDKPKLGFAGRVMHLGRSSALVDGSGTAIAVGDWLGPNASGVFVKKATADFAVCARALQAATAANVIIDVMVVPAGFWRSAAG